MIELPMEIGHPMEELSIPITVSPSLSQSTLNFCLQDISSIKVNFA